MTENQNEQRNQQSDSKSNQQSTQNSSASIQGKSNINIQDTEKGEDIEEVEKETTFQRSPQFLLDFILTMCIV